MKQPKHEIAVVNTNYSDEYVVTVRQEDGMILDELELGGGHNKRTALKAAAKRLRELADDCDRMAEKEE